jgi:ankyrin repeat protein
MFIKPLTLILLSILISASQVLADEIHIAASNGDLNKVRTLLEADSTQLESKDASGSTPLLCACRRNPTTNTRQPGQIDVAMFLVERGANVNVLDKNGITILRAAFSGMDRNLGLVRKLLEHGASLINPTGGMGYLHQLVHSGDVEVASLLIEFGADVNLRDKGCYGTVLQMALTAGSHEEMVKLLLDSGAKVDQVFSYGNVELHLAVFKGYTNSVRWLLEHGANPNLKNDYGHTPLYEAMKHGQRGIAKLLSSAGAKKEEKVERNFGKAPQLKKKLKEGEAYLWYLDGYFGGGYAIKTQNHLIVFDKTNVNESNDAGLVNGNLNPKELAGQNVTVFVTKVVEANFEKNAFELFQKYAGACLVLDDNPAANFEQLPPYRLATPNEHFVIEGMTVHTIPAMGKGNGGAVGLGYLIEVDGLKLFNAGFHASINKAAQIEKYRKGIDFLKTYGPIDFVFLPILAHLTLSYEPYFYLIDQLQPKAIYLVGGEQCTEEYQKCVKFLQLRGVPVYYPEGGRSMGERFHFRK